MTNNVTEYITSGSIACDISDHFPVFFCCNSTSMKKKEDKRTSRNFNQDNMSKFRDNIRNLSWQDILSEITTLM
jgi:hypothetical protein